MAIKGKGKTKQRQAARAPRREPVPVKPPFGQRTWVKATSTFIAGVFLVSMCWWVWENLDKDRNAKAAANDRTLQQEAISQWKGTIDTDLADVAQIQGGAPPQVATTIQPALDALAKGKPPGVTTDQMKTLAGQLHDAAAKLAKFKLSDAISDHGFTPDQTSAITAAQTELVAALHSFEVAARLTGLALETPGQQDALVAAASTAMDNGNSLLIAAWTKYSNASSDAGMPLALPQGLSPTGGS
jgi:hypothetical protein